MPISVVFDPPLPSDSPSTFNTKAFTLLGDLNDWSTQANALPGEVATNLSALLAAPPAIGSTTPAAGSFTALSASGTITSTKDGTILTRSGASTAAQIAQLANTGGNALVGVESSAGGSLVTGSSPYATFLSSFTSTPVQIGCNGALIGSFSASGLAVTGALSASGSITSSAAPNGGNLKRDVDNSYLTLFGGTTQATSSTLLLTGPSYAAAGAAYLDANTVTFRSLNGAADKATLDSSGNLGLGVTPSTSDYSGAATILNVKGNSSGKIGAVKVQSFGTANATGIELFAADGLNEAGLLIKGAATPMVFFTGSTPTKRATLDASGNLTLASGSLTIGSFTVATRPAHAAGKMIYVSDGGGGAVFQGSNGSSWVNLG